MRKAAKCRSFKGTNPVPPSSISPILRLPAELRNAIYKLSLANSTSIRIPAAGPVPPEPGLLSTCSQIRNEALEFYYKTNHFSFEICDLNADMLLQFSARSELHHNATRKARWSGIPKWTNLKEWLLVAFAGDIAGDPARNRDNVPVPKYVHSTIMCFEVMRRLKRRGMDWEQVEEVLEDMYVGIRAVDDTWR